MPRILMTMAEDGLMFSVFSVIHPTLKTPLFATLLSGLFAGKYTNAITRFMIAMCNIDPVRLINDNLQVLSRRCWTSINWWIWCQSAPCWRTRSCAFACSSYGTKMIRMAMSSWKIRATMNQRPVVSSRRWKDTLTCPTLITPTQKPSAWPRPSLCCTVRFTME